MEERHLSLSEAAAALDISERTAYRWIKSGKLRAYKPGRDYWIPESAIENVVKESEVRPKDESRSSLEPSFNDVLEAERHRHEYLRDELRAQGLEVNNSEAIVLAQYLEAHENPPTDVYVIGHVKKKGEPVNHERVLMLLAFVLRFGILTDEEAEAAIERLRHEFMATQGS